MIDDFKMITISGKQIVCGGIGRLFFEDGFPIHLSVDILKEKGIEVSYLHIADELYKNGWKPRAIINTLSQDFPGCEELVTEFINAATMGEKRDDAPPAGQEWIYSKMGYEQQREMLFNFVFGFSSAEAMANPEKRNKMSKIFLA